MCSWQACKLASPIASASSPESSSPSRSAIALGQGLLSTVKADTSRTTSVGYQVLIGCGPCGIGLVQVTSAYFPILLPIPVSANVAALSSCAHSIWGFAIGGTIPQNRLPPPLPEEFYDKFPAGVAVAYTAISRITGLSEPLWAQVQNAFADALVVTVVWRAHLIMGATGLAFSLAMRGLPLHDQTNEQARQRGPVQRVSGCGKYNKANRGRKAG
ncbi:hypothetical protein EVJ58_g10974 [Rhodofomes roseus]|uniref:Uncharacterized protein n=1 Tax=Rhodofomes roseus TaxID=34475 RepID=A0A4Y9XQ17_9APHY|nr:hypothetical protein EVJ58_g10974 [Rhodofomes roseus]